MIIKEKRRHAAAVHVVNMQAVHIPILFVPLRRFSRWETASPPPPSTVSQGGVSEHSSISKKGLVSGAKQPVLAAF
jgi:hypothetical protein